MYVLDYDRQISLMKEMTQLRKNDEKWEVYYHHPSTNEMWKSYFPKANGEKRGPKILRTEPIPEKLEERLDLCLADGDAEDAIGLGIELSIDPTKWEKVLSIIEENLGAYDRVQLKLFFKNLCLFDYEAHFEELHIKPEQFGLTAKKIRQMGWSARKALIKKLWPFS